ncbi:hypothetical protein DFP72DRAFT_1010406 [Ephemerocybe angulata]|uniref:Protein transport protein SEC31 n=1 Tax=Ephemerocybe angulata TaxID=980116 RepID=A0A8H6HUV5_9AGAR|nr:hypothetical protein DFP72DRAFT_1010406 [Tulosesus angulatus]
MKLKEIHRTSTFAWSPSSTPLLATGTVAGALDESFSNESQLEIWAPNFLEQDEYDLGGIDQKGPRGSVHDTARFNRLAWGYVNSSRPSGVIAAGLENGELALWDPERILAGDGAEASLILRNTIHNGPVRGLDFNPIQTNLLASGAVGGEVYIWDLKDPSKPYTPTPGSTSSKLDEITSVAWNQQVQYVLAGASSSGYTVVWDLRGKREVVALAYGGAGGVGQNGGGRRGMSDIAWHPDNATRVITASEDDTSPIIMVWDLRNARAPEKILTGHEKGVLSLSWCKQDADLLLSCGKDNRALCWNPQTSEIIGELPSADNWAFQVEWNPRNPDILATAFFDGTIGIHSIQTTNEAAAAPTPQADGADIFNAPGFARSSTGGTLSLKQPPKWLRRPVSSSFGFGGKLLTVSNLPSSQGKNQSSVVHIRSVVTEQDLVERAKKLQEAIAADDLKAFAEGKTEGSESWKALLSLFNSNSRDELVTLLGFSKADIAARVAEAVETLKASAEAKVAEEESADITEEREQVVSFAEPLPSDGSDAGEGNEVSDTASSLLGDGGESTTTVPSLFGEDDGPGTPQVDGQDFFSTVPSVPHTDYGIDASVAATIGSGPSSVASEVIRNNTFKIYPADESETDRLVTKALVLGDFESAVTLCLSSDRFADAILLAARGGPELLAKTQKAYFERRTTALPYLRLFQSIVTNDLADIVQNADLQEWQEIFVVLCTFATEEEFAGLAEQLGARLEFQYAVAKEEGDEEAAEQAKPFRKNATLTYLASARLERLVNIWTDELGEEEKQFLEGGEGSYFSAHANALQTFVEKVATFRAATQYKDDDLNLASSSDDSVKTFKLATLYDRYFEYADLLATQGLLKEATEILKLTPAAYKGTSSTVDRTSQRQRLVNATASSSKPAAAPRAAPSNPAPRAPYGGYTHAAVVPAAPVAPSAPTYPSYQPTQPAYTQPQQPYNNTGYQQQQASTYQPTNAYNPTNVYAPSQPQQAPVPPPVGPPPPPRGGAGTPSNGPPIIPAAQRRNIPGWNDAPPVPAANNNGTKPAALNLNKPPAITSPFPNASPSASPYIGQPSTPLPPPPRPGSVARGSVPPPPQNARVIHAPPPQARPSSVPPNRLMSPPVPGGPQRQPTPSQYAPPLQAQSSQYAPSPQQQQQQGAPGPYSRPAPPPQGPYGARATPPPQHHQQPPPPPGPYAPQGVQHQPSQQQQQQQFHQQQHQQHQQQQQHGHAPPPPSGPYAPPPGSSSQGLPPPPPSARLGSGGPPPPPGGPASGAPPRAPAAPARQGPPAPKYPPGDREHIPDHVRPAYNVLVENLNRFKQTTPQKAVVQALENRLNGLFDALNCETLSPPVVDMLIVLCQAIGAHDRPAALAIHVDMLTRGSQTDDIGMWMAGVKQLIMRLQ